MSTRILAIETSCDETAMAILECKGGLRQPRFKILADVVSSQIPIHRPFGGVVPMLAKREHLKNLPIVFKKLIKKFNKNCHSALDAESKINNFKKCIPDPAISEARQGRPVGDDKLFDLIAVTVGPGLEPALWTGINFAKELGKKMKVTVVSVNHLEGHIFSNWLPTKNYELGIGNYGKLKNKNPNDHSNVLQNIRMVQNKISFPAIVLLVSGGHTILVIMKSLTKWKILGETRDDAAGEAFDKVARMLNLPYPGGPEVEKLARELGIRNQESRRRRGSPKAAGIMNNELKINFPRPMIYDKSYDFSFSGLKTAVLYYLRDQQSLKPDTRHPKPVICASFQQAVVDVLVHKTIRATKEFNAESILLCGGVACNKALKRALELGIRNKELGIKFFVPDKKFNTDNAVMIGAAAYINYLRKKKLPLKANGNLNL